MSRDGLIRNYFYGPALNPLCRQTLMASSTANETGRERREPEPEPRLAPKKGRLVVKCESLKLT